MKVIFGVALSIFHIIFNPSDSGAVQLNKNNIDSVLAEYEFVFINFYADWCRFSNMLSPIWDEAAEKLASMAPKEGKALMAKVDCDKEAALGSQFSVTKYPTLKYVRGGVPAKKEYRGKRDVQSFLKFVEEQMVDPVKQFSALAELDKLDESKEHVIGYFEENSPDYANFKRVAILLKDDCDFLAGFGDVVRTMHPPKQSIVAFRPSRALSREEEETFTGQLMNFDELKNWATERCTPLIRRITFQNAEELTDEGIPFLILFHKLEDKSSVKEFSEVVKSIVEEGKQNVNFLLADGEQFSHPLHHLGKSMKDLPLIAIDSFKHMYLLPKFSDIHIPGRLKQFLQDLHSGKLHREFHYGPDPIVTSTTESPKDDKILPPQTDDNAKKTRGNAPQWRNPSPPPSQFQHLAPSKNRYTLLRDEF